eukprot:4833219-Pyramimonas_sp.AAC.1
MHNLAFADFLAAKRRLDAASAGWEAVQTRRSEAWKLWMDADRVVEVLAETDEETPWAPIAAPTRRSWP